jgi:agmatine/peptidylarginine deiminase
MPTIRPRPRAWRKKETTDMEPTNHQLAQDCDTVYLTAALHRHPHVFEELHRHLQDHNIKINIIVDTDNIWCRDYMPLQVNDHFVKFRYKSGLSNYDFEKYPQLQVSPFVYGHLLGLTYSDIVLDGGNCERFGEKAIITNIVYRHNHWLKKKRIIDMLEKLLDAEIIIIPHEPYDNLGHADGILKWIDDKTVFVEDFDNKKYLEKLCAVLMKHGLEPILFPYTYNQMPKVTEKQFRKKYPEADDFNPGYGYYINYLHVKNLILVPQFGIEEDSKALALLKKYLPNNTIKGINCSDLSMEGGLINCVTMNYKEV